MKPFLVALRFLTRFPVSWNSPTDEEVGRSMLYYPLVGLLMGLPLAALAWALGEGVLAAALIVTAWVLLTGLLHMDGLADTADAWIGGLGDRERTLEIMKDPRCGPAGVTALILLVLVKFAAVFELLALTGGWMALILAPLLGRAAILPLFLLTEYVRSAGMATLLARHLPRRGAWLVTAGVALAVVILGGMAGVWALAGAALVFLLGRAWMVHRLGGTTGDTAGGLIELVEAGVLLAVVLALQ
ncbi:MULTISPECIES: adenosylcobinamide-GDP ribazoletransferase [Ectothiorhodospira]|uniref:adenosylcobinamide-GDP ribazoletransferase n=1 Tax=Ectothiorhodospira TaxID=1051 RepID=UPI00024A8384|nr:MULTISPECIES: adenosylcobinamide-GDP ribazoletransferase [Ectothiorhodospira]EHQ52175.1 cobalamin 5'-phosphate synthase [Ectothiorhodospira sp. PHS-1]MCG5513594.1 adenosylcobinamide-GDP ribazoletransferase [Ectothiorhodospira shaposhnikovii]